jgi:hypothetical protein
MNQMQRTGGAAIEIWRTLPIWAKVVAGIVAAIGLYYSFALILGMFFLTAMGVGVFTLLRWLLRR